jgi:hypothetical protein
MSDAEIKLILQRGAARKALDVKRYADGGCDAHGAPLVLAHNLAKGYSEGGLRKLARQKTPKTIVVM